VTNLAYGIEAKMDQITVALGGVAKPRRGASVKRPHKARQLGSEMRARYRRTIWQKRFVAEAMKPRVAKHGRSEAIPEYWPELRTPVQLFLQYDPAPILEAEAL
jgi:hypothetical protein